MIGCNPLNALACCIMSIVKAAYISCTFLKFALVTENTVSLLLLYLLDFFDFMKPTLHEDLFAGGNGHCQKLNSVDGNDYDSTTQMWTKCCVSCNFLINETST